MSVTNANRNGDCQLKIRTEKRLSVINTNRKEIVSYKYEQKRDFQLEMRTKRRLSVMYKCKQKGDCQLKMQTEKRSSIKKANRKEIISYCTNDSKREINGHLHKMTSEKML